MKNTEFTEAMWPNLGIIPHIICENGNVLIRTLNGSLSQRSNAIQMILATKQWTFVIGNRPKTEHSIMTQRHFYEVKCYSREAPSSLIPSVSLLSLNSNTGNSNVSNELQVQRIRETFIDMFREIVSRAGSNAFRLKPEQRKLLMILLCKEWKSLLSLPLSRRNESGEVKHISFRDFHNTIHIGIKTSFVIEHKVYSTGEYRNKTIEEFLESLE